MYLRLHRPVSAMSARLSSTAVMTVTRSRPSPDSFPCSTWTPSMRGRSMLRGLSSRQCSCSCTWHMVRRWARLAPASCVTDVVLQNFKECSKGYRNHQHVTLGGEEPKRGKSSRPHKDSPGPASH